MNKLHRRVHKENFEIIQRYIKLNINESHVRYHMRKTSIHMNFLAQEAHNILKNHKVQ